MDTSASPPTFWKNNVTLGAKPYIGCPYPCPWVLGGHGRDIVVHGWHGWAWVDTCHAMGGHRLLLMGVVWGWVQIRRKCWSLITSFFVYSERSLHDLNDTLWCALVAIHNFELDLHSKALKFHICCFLFYMVIHFDFLPIFLMILHYAQIFKMWHYQICHTLVISLFLVNRMVWHYQG